MQRQNKKEHLKFTLFPFVSILLAVVGVLLFLTMLQAIILKAETPEKDVVEENQVVFERIPELSTHIIEFNSNGIQLKLNGKEPLDLGNAPYEKVYKEIFSNLIQLNKKYISEEYPKREHLLYVVRPGGEKKYFGFIQFMRDAYNQYSPINPQMASENFLIFPRYATDEYPINPYLPIGLVLLNETESLVLK